jgi:long-subunit acyl-CoA synthetase (AMP-forming)
MHDTGVRSLSWSQYQQAVSETATGFLACGVKPGDTVAIMATNRPEHLIADLATSLCGAASMSIYLTLSDPQLEHVLGDASPTVIAVDDESSAERIAALPTMRQSPAHFIVFESDSRKPPSASMMTFEQLQSQGRAARNVYAGELHRDSTTISPDAPLVYVYTSGTTGPSKGVILTHRNISCEMDALLATGAFNYPYRSVSYLPLAHLAERIWSLYMPLRVGGHVFCCPDPAALATSVRQHRPTFFLGVPRIWEKLRDLADSVIAAKSAQRQGDIDRARRILLSQWQSDCNENGGTATGLGVGAEDAKAMLSGVRSEIGLEETVMPSCSAAPIAPALLDYFASLGIRIHQAYGLTETAGVSVSQRPGHCGAGVGTALPGCEVRIAADGEILLRSPATTTPGYRNRPDETAQLYDQQGWLLTGDVGRLEPDGRLFVTDRKKNLIINAAGKNIAPAPIESLLSGRSFIDRSVVIGDSRPHLIALLALNEPALHSFAQENEIGVTDMDALHCDPKIWSHLEMIIGEVNACLSRPEQIKRFAVVDAPFTVESGELTPTFKVRRSVIEQRYQTLIDQLYAQPHPTTSPPQAG